MKKAQIFLLVLLFSVFFVSSVSKAHALECDFSSQHGAPSPQQMLCPVWKVVVGSQKFVGVVFVFMLGVGAIKLAVAQGDPKGLASAGSTWMYATIGVFVVLSVVTLLTFVGNAFGIEDIISSDAVLENAEGGVNGFLEEMGIIREVDCSKNLDVILYPDKCY